MNSVSATFFMIILLDLKQFIRLFSIGVTLGLTLHHYILHNAITYVPKEIFLKDIIATYIAVIVIGSLFAPNKESIENERERNTNKIKKLNNSLEIKVKNRTKELEKALSAKGEFLNNISHEIRTPVSGFMAISEGLEEHWNVLDEQKKLKYVQDIASSAQRLGSLIGNLLDLSDFIANKNYINITKFNLSNLINNVVNNSKYLQYNKNNLSINFVLSHKEAYVNADKKWISQALDNLLSNALKFTPDNGHITISLDKDKKFWQFTISDDGIGIPQNEITSIFDPFTLSSRTKTKAGGRGLGLAICSKIFEAHDGKIWAENNKDKGASFHFTLPINTANVN
ncbi:MAG: HAMP domain-containing sensor histidine kinase [Rickettsiales bacterium]